MTKTMFGIERAIKPEEYDIHGKFARYNRILFNDELSYDIVLGFQALRFTRKARGVFFSSHPNPVSGRIEAIDCRIMLDNSVEYTESSYDGTLIHEMVHMYLFINLNNPSMENGGHHAQFWQILNEKNDIARDQFGIEIPTTELSEDQRVIGTRRQNMCLGLFRLKGDPTGVVRFAPMLPSVFEEVVENFQFKVNTKVKSKIGAAKGERTLATRPQPASWFYGEAMETWPFLKQVDWDQGIELLQVSNSELSVKLALMGVKMSQRFLGKQFWVTSQAGLTVAGTRVNYNPDIAGLIDRAKHMATGRATVKDDGVYINGEIIHRSPVSKLNENRPVRLPGRLVSYTSTTNGLIIAKSVVKADLPEGFMQAPSGQRFRALILNSKTGNIDDDEWTHASADAEGYDVLLYIRGADETAYDRRRVARRIFNDLPESVRQSNAIEYAETVFNAVHDDEYGLYNKLRLSGFLNALANALGLPAGTLHPQGSGTIGTYLPMELYAGIRLELGTEMQSSTKVQAAAADIYKKLGLSNTRIIDSELDAGTFMRDMLGSAYAFAIGNSLIGQTEPYIGETMKLLSNNFRYERMGAGKNAGDYYAELKKSLEAIASYSLQDDDKYAPIREFVGAMQRASVNGGPTPISWQPGTERFAESLDVAKGNFDRSGGVLNKSRFQTVMDAVNKVLSANVGSILKETASSLQAALAVLDWYVTNVPYSNIEGRSPGKIDFDDMYTDLSVVGKQLGRVFNADDLFVTGNPDAIMNDHNAQYRDYSLALYVVGGYDMQMSSMLRDGGYDTWERILATANGSSNSIIPQKIYVPDLLQLVGGWPSSDAPYERSDYSSLQLDWKRDILQDAGLTNDEIESFMDNEQGKPLDEIPEFYAKAFGGYKYLEGHGYAVPTLEIVQEYRTFKDPNTQRILSDWQKLHTDFQPGSDIPEDTFGKGTNTFAYWETALKARFKSRLYFANTVVRQNNRSMNFPFKARVAPLPAELTPEEQSILHYFKDDPDWVVYVEDIYKKLLNAEMGTYGINLLLQRGFVEKVNPGQRNESIRLTPAGRAWFDANVAGTETEEEDEYYLPEGWTEATPGGMATNKDPENGGIIDRNYHGWFIVFNDGRATIDDLSSRAEAFKVFFATPKVEKPKRSFVLPYQSGDGFQLPLLFRGTEAGTNANTALRVTDGGDIGNGIYLSPSEQIAKSYGGGSDASVSKGTRVVYSYTARLLKPEEVLFVFGGAKVKEDVSLVNGHGIELYHGPWEVAKLNEVIGNQAYVKAVIGTPGSIGVNQVSVRDGSILTPVEEDTKPEVEPEAEEPKAPERDVKAPKVKTADGKSTWNITIGVNEKTKKLMFVPVEVATSNNIALVRKRIAKPVAVFLSYVFAEDLARITGKIRAANRKAAARELAALATAIKPYIIAANKDNTPFPLKLAPLVERDFGEGLEGQKHFMRYLQGKATTTKKVHKDVERLKVLVDIEKPKPGSKEEAIAAYYFVGLDTGPFESAMPLPLNWDKSAVGANTSYKKRIDYIVQRAQKLGKGSSRTAFIIKVGGKESVLKVAHNEKGRHQNQAEVDILEDGYIKQLGIAIPLIDYDTENRQPIWVNVAKADKISDKDLCARLKCFDLFVLVNTAKYRSGSDRGTYAIKSLEEYAAKNERNNQIYGKTPSQVSKAYETFSEYVDLMNNFISYSINIADFTTARNWGLYRGKPVVIDVGLSDSVSQQYYRHTAAAEAASIVPNFDNSKGLGNTPYGAEISYRGMITKVRPSTFLKIAAPVGHGKREDSIEFIVKHLKDGGAIATPSLKLAVPEAWKDSNDCSSVAHGIGHEGRHRMMAIQKVYGDEPVSVQVVLECDNGRNIRNREWTDAMRESLSRSVYGEETNSLVLHPFVGGWWG